MNAMWTEYALTMHLWLGYESSVNGTWMEYWWYQHLSSPSTGWVVDIPSGVIEAWLAGKSPNWRKLEGLSNCMGNYSAHHVWLLEDNWGFNAVYRGRFISDHRWYEWACRLSKQRIFLFSQQRWCEPTIMKIWCDTINGKPNYIVMKQGWYLR